MKRFKISARYDPECDRTQWRDCYNPSLFKASSDPVKRALIKGAQSASGREMVRRNAERSNAIGAGRDRALREKAERQAADTVRQVVRALEIAMHNLNGVRAPSTYERSVNQLQVLCALRHLKMKCGVYFDSDEFTQSEVTDVDGVRRNVSMK